MGLRHILMVLVSALIAAGTRAPQPPSLADFWDGAAEWVVDVFDSGLPVGESDTVYRGNGEYWSYLHASSQSAGVIDQCGDPVAFPGCTTLWRSTDGGAHFSLVAPTCLIPCQSCPCDDERDHITAQQYPRVAFAGDQSYLAYEWHAQVILRRALDGIRWSDWSYLRTPGGTWPSALMPCSPVEKIGPHPNIRGEIYDCLVGAPPGIFVEGEEIYVFVAAGSAPGHMRCYRGDRRGDLSTLRLCDHDPLFSGAREYGPLDITEGPATHPYFDFRYVSSADVLEVNDRFYMAYEGIRGPDILERGMDTQFGLGFARSMGAAIDGPWEKYAGNPVIMPVGFNFGIGHADLLIVDGVTIMYTATSPTTRGRYVLRWANRS